MNLPFRFNRCFSEVFTTTNRIIDIWGGRARGGSHFCTDYFLFKLTQPAYFRGVFVRQVHKDIRDSLFKDFNDRLDEMAARLSPEEYSEFRKCFEINNSEMRILYVPTGNTIISKGATSDGARTAKLKSIAGATHVIWEEVEEANEEDYNQLEDSLRTVKDGVKLQIFRIFNPPGKNHWIWRNYDLLDNKTFYDSIGKEYIYYSAVPKKGTNILSIHTNYTDNIHNVNSDTILKFERYKDTNPDYYYTIVLGYISSGLRGKIFRNWKRITDSEYEALPYRQVYFLDWGYSNDPAAIGCLKSQGNSLYVKELVYHLGLTNIQLAKRLIDCGYGLNKDVIVADSAEMKSIVEFRTGWPNIDGYPQLKHGFNMIAASKGKGSVAAGITDLQSLNIHATESSVNLWQEYDNYRWAVDRNKEPIDEPVDRDNHLIDGIRYYRQRMHSI